MAGDKSPIVRLRRNVIARSPLHEGRRGDLSKISLSEAIQEVYVFPIALSLSS